MKTVGLKYKFNNKGFSLIELVIVVAIMAVLIAVLAPQFIRYIEKSKMGKDTEVAGVVQRAINVAMADPSIDDRPVSFG
nr:prepilin-type N-terminal cleavage/methylation domain-containing protein [Lachnospiraceae bacterium]